MSEGCGKTLIGEKIDGFESGRWFFGGEIGNLLRKRFRVAGTSTRPQNVTASDILTIAFRVLLRPAVKHQLE